MSLQYARTINRWSITVFTDERQVFARPVNNMAFNAVGEEFSPNIREEGSNRRPRMKNKLLANIKQ